MLIRPGPQRERLLIRINECVAEGFDYTLRCREFEKDRLTVRSINQNPRYPPLSVVLRSRQRAICDPAAENRNRICPAERIRNNPQIRGRAQQPFPGRPGADPECRYHWKHH